MAMWSMIALAVAGDGFWTPVNAIAHTFWSDAPLDGTFSAGALALGLIAHMMLSAGLGVAILTLADRYRDARATVAIAFAVSAAAWVGGVLLWHAVDDAASNAFTGWIFAVGHIVFAMTAAAGAFALADDRSTRESARGRRAVHV